MSTAKEQDNDLPGVSKGNPSKEMPIEYLGQGNDEELTCWNEEIQKINAQNTLKYIKTSSKKDEDSVIESPEEKRAKSADHDFTIVRAKNHRVLPTKNSRLIDRGACGSIATRPGVDDRLKKDRQHLASSMSNASSKRPSSVASNASSNQFVALTSDSDNESVLTTDNDNTETPQFSSDEDNPNSSPNGQTNSLDF